MKYETAGDPISGLLWTKKTREKISDALAEANIDAGKTTVGKILKKLGYSLKCNSKKVANGGKKLSKEEKLKRNEQFLYIAKMRKKFEKKGLPIISVDTKKKELIGNFKNPGTRLKKVADLTNDHDFATHAVGRVIPYGLFDDQRLEGFVYAGQALWDKDEKKFTSSETPEFAADCISMWWGDYGAKRYQNAGEALILADAGGSNGYNSRVWKNNLFEKLCNKHGVKLTICHYPPGASKWNPIEHRLFSEITKNWAGTPLISFETVLKYLRSTKTKTGLKVKARLIKKRYKTGKSVSKKDFERIKIKRHDTIPEWNYTIFSDR
jgi:hypothetical protein